MLNKKLIRIIGFGLGAFMLFNSIVVLSKILQGAEWVTTPFERLLSLAMSLSVSTVLLTWTHLLTKKR